MSTWQVSGVYTRPATPVRELNWRTFGRVVDLVPGVNDPYTASATRTEVWGEEFEKAVGYDRPFTDLIDQTFPFEADEVWLKGRAPYRTNRYRGCWITEGNLDQWSAEGNAMITRTVNISFVSKESFSLG